MSKNLSKKRPAWSISTGDMPGLIEQAIGKGQQVTFRCTFWTSRPCDIVTCVPPGVCLVSPLDPDLRVPLMMAINISHHPELTTYPKHSRQEFILIFGPIPDHWEKFSLTEYNSKPTGFTECSIKRNATHVYRAEFKYFPETLKP